MLILKFQDISQDIKTTQTRWNDSSHYPKSVNKFAVCFVYLQQCQSTSLPFSFQGPVHSWVWGSNGQGRPLPEADINACVPIHWTHDLQACSKISGHLQKFTTRSKFQEIPGHRPGLRKRSLTRIFFLCGLPTSLRRRGTKVCYA